jgi:hypothetical protein
MMAGAMNRRRFLGGIGAVLFLPPESGRPAAETVIERPVTAVLVGTGGRSDPIVFDGARPRPKYQVGAHIPIPPLDFRPPMPGTVTHVELTEGTVTEIVRIWPERTAYAGDRVRVAGLVWRG